MRLILALWLGSVLATQAASWTEFYVQTTGSNLNAGSTTADAALVSLTGGDWVASTGVYTKAGANLSAVTVGMWASVYIDGATVGVFVGRITAVDDTADTVTVSLTAVSGTPPADGTANRSLKVGGAWKGPNAAEAFPLAFVTSTLTDSSGHPPRVNIKSGVSYSVTAAMTHANAGPMKWEGYTATIADGGRATITTGTGASYTILTLSAVNNVVEGIIFLSASTSGTSTEVSSTGAENIWSRCVFTGARGSGLAISGGGAVVACEAYNCNVSNSANAGGFTASSVPSFFVRCIAHDNPGSNVYGFRDTGGSAFVSCIASGNGANGIQLQSTIANSFVSGCDLFNNAGAGIDLTGASASGFVIENCNLIDNVLWGISSTVVPAARNGIIANCGFGSGTRANGSGQVDPTMVGVTVIGSITYASDVTPWVDPTNGDFRVNLATAKGTGIGTFTETAAGYTGTIGYPDVGAAQHLEAATGARSHTFGQ